MIRSYLSARDQAIIQTVHDFRQLTSSQVKRLFFSDLSPTCQADMARKALARLTKWQELTRIEERAIGGWASGSHGFVYMMPNGQAQIRDPHTLAVAELYVELKEAERMGRCQILDYELEANLRGIEPITDMYLRIQKADGVYRYCVEVDKSTESKQRIEQKLRGYIKSYEDWHGTTFPQVIFCVSTERQLKMIRKAISECRIPELFTANSFEDSIALLT